MDWLKKYYEKITLAIALVLVIGSGVYLSLQVGKLSTEIQSEPQYRGTKSELVVRTPLHVYTNALAHIRQPFLWKELPQDPFLGLRTTPVVAPTNTTSVQPRIEPIVTYIGITRLPFRLLFKTYSWNAETKMGYNFQLNFLDRARSFFVSKIGDKVADKFEDTGYVLTSFERSMTNQVTAVGLRELDLSRATVQRKGEDPIILPVNQIVEERKPIATIRVRGEPEARKITSGQSFNCEGKTYNVVDITSRQMVIVESTSPEKSITIPLGVQP